MDVIVKDLLPGQKYILQARSKNQNGVSQWSNSFKMTTISDTTPPAPITGLTWVVNKTSFHAEWVKPTLDSDGSTLKDFNGYEITVTAASISKKFISMQEVFDLTFDQNVAAFGTPQPSVQITVKTRDIMGNLATAVTATASNPVPADLSGLIATGVPMAIFLDWDDTVENDFKCYEIYMSKVSSGFTPGPSNLLATTANSQFSFPSSDFTTTHYFKIRQLDVFNQASNYIATSGTPLNNTLLDTTPPGAPTAVTVSTAADSAGTSHINVSWTAPTSTNLGGYVVRYSTDQVTWRFIGVPADSTSTTISNLVPNVAYYVSVASVSFVSSYSAWVHAGTYPITTAKDTTAPSTPVAPSVSFNTQTVQVTHSLAKAAGGNLESDVRYLEVHGSVTTGFTASSTTLIGTLDVAGQGISAVGSFPAPVTDSTANMYWVVIAVDYAGNKSAQSAQATGLPGLIQGANIASATITDAKIGSLSASKLIAGTAFINNLSVQSQLTLDASSGYIASTNFSIPSKTGWRLDQNGLVIYDGSIAAKSLLLQNGNNITPPPFADFEFNETYYHDSTNLVNTGSMTATTGMLLAMQYTGIKVGKQSLRLWNTSITGSTIHKLHFATGGDAATGVNIDVNPGDYIVSIWAKKNGAVDQTLKFGVYPDTGSAIESSGIPVTTTAWTRYSAVLTIPSGVSKIKQYISLQAVTTGYDLVIDALQLEPKLTGDTTPSAWKPPSTTIIDGGAIITGSIRSSAASATVTGQPAWSINTAGNMQIGDALVRGKLTMGVPSDQRNLVPKMYSSFENTASDYYNVSTNVPNATNLTVAGTNASNLRLQQSTAGTVPHGTYGLRIYATSGLSASGVYDLYLGSGNILLVPGQQYIISGYVKNNDATKGTKIALGIYNPTNGFNAAVTATSITTSYVRYSGIVTAPSASANTIYLAMVTQAGETTFDVSWDAIQVEVAPVGVTTPSTFNDGTIGLSSMASSNFISGSQGWSINSDGTVEFNAATIRGQLFVAGANGTIKTDTSGLFPTIFFNGNDGSQAFINAASGTGSKALLGLNSASFTQASNTVRPRLWMPDQIRLEIVDETASAAAGAPKNFAGALVMDSTSNRLSIFSSTNKELSAWSQDNTGVVRIQSFDTSHNERSAANFDNNSVIITNKSAAGALYGNITLSTSQIIIGTDNNIFLSYDYSTGYLKRNPDGDWTGCGLSNGWSNVSGLPLELKKSPDGRVWLRGIVSSGTTGGGGVDMGTIPASSYYPAREANFHVASDSAANNIVKVQTNGVITIYNSTAGNYYFDGTGYSMT